ncbi:arylsulfatase A family protein, partial [Xenococcus sp. PCC 7305]|uniref:sulfatase-like hydrolase/transferase n=1 Tax=Xenococcus sp. PCC 7305 TaxID=102125 RepID=UPI0002ACB535
MTDQNILLISIDDLLNVDKFRNYFNVEIKTPNLDAFRDKSISFSNAFATTALCNPSRTSVLAGQSSFKTKTHWNNDVWYENIDPAITLPALMKNAGYTVRAFGKNFHQGNLPPGVENIVFDSNFAPSFVNTYQAGINGPFKTGIIGAEEQTGDSLVVREAIDALHQTDSNNSLFMMVGLVDPHTPFVSPQQYRDLYPLEDIVIPTLPDGDYPDFVKQFLNTAALQNIDAANFLPEYIQSYLANISEMDARLGELLDEVENSDLNPIIALWSDHGYHLGDHDTLHKFTLWDQAANAQLMFFDPDNPVSGEVSQVVSFLDIAPTILDLAGIDVPEYMDGNSLKEKLYNLDLELEGVAITTMFGSLSIRTNEYRYTRYEDGSRELYDVVNDPYLSNNLADLEQYSETVDILHQELITKVDDYGVTIDEINNLVIYEEFDGFKTVFSPTLGTIEKVGFSLDDYIELRTPDNYLVMPDWGDGFVFSGAKEENVIVIGNKLDNSVIGGFANDFLNLNQGDDYADGYRGSDKILGGDGNDTIDGSIGNDTISGGNDNDSLIGGKGNDIILGGEGDDTVLGGDGDDRILGNMGSDRLSGNIGNDTIFGGEGDDTVLGGDGDDR